MIPLRDTLQQFRILDGLAAAQLQQLTAIIQPRTLTGGETLFREGDASTDIFFVVEGEIELLVGGADGTTTHRVSAITAGGVFGDMAFLDDEPRSATARATHDAHLLVLSKHALRQIPDGAVIELQLARRIGSTIAGRLRTENANLVASYERERAAQQRQHEFGRFFIYILVCFAIGMLATHLMATKVLGVEVHSDLFTWTYLGILLLPSVILVRVLRIPLDRVGVTLSGWRQSLSEGAVATLVLGALALALVVVVRMTGVIPFHAPDLSILGKPEYLVHSYGQEFLARGLLQGSLQRFFDDRRGRIAVLLSSALFALLHIHFGVAAIVLTFVSSVPLGFLYLRHRNLLGVTLLHFMMGVIAFATGLL